MAKVTFEPKSGVASVEVAVQGYDKLVKVDESGTAVDPDKDPLLYAALSANPNLKTKGTSSKEQPAAKEGGSS